MQKIKLILICLFLACCLCSCRERGSSEDRVSDGQQSNVGWFLFIFDNRSAQQQLVKDMADGNIPGKLTVRYYALKYDEDYSWQEVLMDDYTTVLEDKDLPYHDQHDRRRTAGHTGQPDPVQTGF